ncbi:MAG: TolC family protein [Bacteroidetes bacterium]|nr:TolC family protein [Bacteroidota bacterium]
MIFIIFSANILYGQQPDPGFPDKGLEDIIKASVETNTDLTPVEFEKKILSAKIDQSNFQSSPMLQFMVDFIPVNFSSAGEYVFIYSQPLKLFGKLDAEERLARVNSLKPQIIRNELENKLIMSVKENYFMLSVSEKLLSFNNEFREILNSIKGSLEIRYSSGKGSQYDILKSNNEYQKLLLEEIELTNNRKIFINNLRTLSNLDLPDDFKTKNVEILLNIPGMLLDTAKLIPELKDNNTDFKLAGQMLEENKAGTEVTALERKPDLNLMTGYKYKSDMKAGFLMFSVAVDLPFMPWNEKRIDAEIKENIFREKKINSEVRSLEINLKNEMKNLIVRINNSTEKIKYLTDVLIPQTEQTYKSALIAYETNAGQFIDLLDTFRTLRENNKMLVEEETNYLVLISKLENLIGKQILTIN